MPLHSGNQNAHGGRRLSVNPFVGAANPVPGMEIAPPRHQLPEGPMPPDIAYQLIHDELMLDGNARLNLATFVTTWMEPQADGADGGVPRQEHDRQGRVPADRGAGERAAWRCSANLWHAPDARGGRRLLDHRLQRGVHARRAGAQAALGSRNARPATPTEPGPTW